MKQLRFRVKGVQNVLHSFLLSKPERYHVKVLNCIIDICGVKYFRTIAYEQAALLLEKQVFLKSTIYFDLRSNHILTKIITFYGNFS